MAEAEDARTRLYQGWGVIAAPQPVAEAAPPAPEEASAPQVPDQPEPSVPDRPEPDADWPPPVAEQRSDPPQDSRAESEPSPEPEPEPESEAQPQPPVVPPAEPDSDSESTYVEPSGIPVEVAADGRTVRIVNREVAVQGAVVDLVLNSLSAFARVAEGPINAIVTDLRPGGYQQRIRVHPDGHSVLLWVDEEAKQRSARVVRQDPKAAPNTASGGQRADSRGTGATRSIGPKSWPKSRSDAQSGPDAANPSDTAPGPVGFGPPTPDFELPPATPASAAAPAAAPVPVLPSIPPTPAPEPAPAQSPPQRDVNEVPGLLPTVNDFLGTPRSAATSPSGALPLHPPSRPGLLGIFKRPNSAAEQARQQARHRAQRLLSGSKTIAVVNPKGGAHKTTSTLLLAAAFGNSRGGNTLAWDNNETRGTLGWRALRTDHQRTAVDLLRDADELAGSGPLHPSQLQPYVRPQGEGMFDLLASDESPDSWSVIDGEGFKRLHGVLSSVYQIMVVDTGNNMRAPNWTAAIDAADSIVIVSTMREDTAASAAWMIDAMRNTGHHVKVANAITVLSATGPKPDKALADRLAMHFGQHTREVVNVPFDQALVHGDQLQHGKLAQSTRDAWLRAAAAVADTL